MTDVPRLGSGIPLVARRHELAVLDAALDRARAGQAGAVLISGDAGVGKTRLLAELCERARAAGDIVLSGGCLDAAEATLPYLPFVDPVRQLAQWRPELIADHPTLGRLLPDARQRQGVAEHDRDLGQLQLFDALYSAVNELAAELEPNTGRDAGGHGQPDLGSARAVLLTIEDLHWADRSSRDLLAFLLSRLGGQRLLIVGTFRADDLHRRHPLRSLLTELMRLPAVERLNLEPFTAADAEEFVRLLADDSVADELVRDIANRSEGNAFMAEELTSACSDSVPRELAEILLARVERLTPAAQQVVRLVSVLGRRFAHPRVAAATDLADDALDAALRDALAHHVLVTEDAYSYAFRHALLREAVYSDLLPGERTRLHARVADALSRPDQPGGAGEQGTAAELAHHRMESHDLPGALRASWQAAEEAAAIDAPAEVLLHAERALKLWHAVADAERLTGVDEVTVTRFAAWAASATGEPDRALAHIRSAVELADASGDDVLAADVRRRYANYLLDLPGNGQLAHRTALDAWRLIEHTAPSATKAWVQAVLARAAADLDRYDEASDFSRRALATAAAVTGDEEQATAEVDALTTLGGCLWRKGDPEQAVRELTAAIGLAVRVGAVGVELRARYRMALLRLEAGQLADALAEQQVALERAASSGLTWSPWGLELRVLKVMTQFMAGDWDGAEATAELAGEAVSGTVATRVSAAALLVAVGRGRFELARRRLAQLRDRWQTDTQVMRLLGMCGAELELWRGRPAQATEWVEQALQWLRHYEPWHLGEIALCTVGVAAYADLAAQARDGRSDQATAAETERAAVLAGAALARRAADAAVNGRPQAGEVGPEALAWLAMVDAETARLRGEPDPARWHAADDAFGYGEPYRQAYARWRGAEALLAGGAAGRDQAADLLRSAHAIADELGAVPLRTAVSKLARRGRIVLDSSTGGLPVDTLTRREHSVLALVAAGRTNRQIGDELFISEKTVSVHLSRVMAKLGARSRTEAVSTAYARGLLTAASS